MYQFDYKAYRKAQTEFMLVSVLPVLVPLTTFLILTEPDRPKKPEGWSERMKIENVEKTKPQENLR